MERTVHTEKDPIRLGKYNDYFAAVLKGTLFSAAIDGQEIDSFTF